MADSKKRKVPTGKTSGGGRKGPIRINPKGVLRDVRKRQRELDKIMQQ